EPEPAQLLVDEIGGGVLLMGQLGVAVQVPAHRTELLLGLGDRPGDQARRPQHRPLLRGTQQNLLRLLHLCTPLRSVGTAPSPVRRGDVLAVAAAGGRRQRRRPSPRSSNRATSAGRSCACSSASTSSASSVSTMLMPSSPTRAMWRSVAPYTVAREETASTAALPSTRTSPSAAPRSTAVLSGTAPPWCSRSCRASAAKSPTSSQPKEAGTTATFPSTASGSARAWSIAIAVRRGHTRSRTSRCCAVPCAAAISRTPAAREGICRDSSSSSTDALTTNIPAFQRN